MVIAAAGAVDHDAIVELARALTPSAGGAETARTPTTPPTPRPQSRRFESKDTEQFHVCVGGLGISRHDDRRFALRVLDTIFGGTSSSRLFQQVREQRGLAYAVYSFTSSYQDGGQVGLYLGTRADNLVEAIGVVGQELEHVLAQPATAEELARAKENLKGRVLLGLESTGARMNRLGSELLAGAPLLSLDEVVEQIDAVTLTDLQELAGQLWAPEHLSFAGIGPDEDAFVAAVDAVALAQAA